MAVEPLSDLDRFLRSLNSYSDAPIPDQAGTQDNVEIQELPNGDGILRLVPFNDEEGPSFEELERMLERGVQRAQERARQNELLRQT